MKPDQERVRHLLTDTVTLLCKNGLQFNKEMKVQGLLGITLDENEVFLVHINETFGNLLGGPDSNILGDDRSDNIFQIAQQQQQILPIESNLPGSQRNVGRPLMKPSIRPMRPASRFGHRFGRDQPIHRHRRTAHHHIDNKVSASQSESSHQGNTAGVDTLESGAFDSQHFSQSGDNLQSTPSGNGDGIQIKTEQEDDVIIVDQKPDSEEINERKAMLGSYLAEASAAESSLAQDIFSEFSTTALVQSGDLSSEGLGELSGSDGGGAYITGLLRNYQNQSGDGGGSSSLMQPSSWDIPSSQASTSFGSSGNRNMPSVG